MFARASRLGATATECCSRKETMVSFSGPGAPQGAAAAGGQASSPPAVEVRAISKDFGSNQALIGVDLRIGNGEVVGLVGQNGSGKSTLVKVLSGVHEPEPGGRLFVSG